MPPMGMDEVDNPEKSVQAWLERVEEDYRTAATLLKAGRYTWCAFACQQFLEKYLKAAYVQRHARVPPYTHSLLRLCKELSLALPNTILESTTRIDRYYLVARYPAYKASVNIADRKSARIFFKSAVEVLSWLKKKLAV